jgi:hypothetical protein
VVLQHAQPVPLVPHEDLLVEAQEAQGRSGRERRREQEHEDRFLTAH